MGKLFIHRKAGQDTWSFNEIQLQDLKLYEAYIKTTDYPANLWSANFDFLWGRAQGTSEKVLWKIIDGMLVTFFTTSRGYLQLPCLPFGRGDAKKVTEILLKCMRYCDEVNGHKAHKTMVRVVNDAQLAFLNNSPKFKNYFKVKKLKGEDRLVGVKKLSSLSGRDLSNVRQGVNKFRRLFPHAIIRRYKESDYKALIKLKEHWNETAGKKYRGIHDENYYREILQHYRELNHLILVAEIKGEIYGMISGGALPNGESWACLAKTRIEAAGLSEVLFVELAREINKTNPNVELMNLGMDIGVKKGLKSFKDKFRPVLNSKRYRIFFK